MTCSASASVSAVEPDFCSFRRAGSAAAPGHGYRWFKKLASSRVFSAEQARRALSYVTAQNASAMHGWPALAFFEMLRALETCRSSPSSCAAVAPHATEFCAKVGALIGGRRDVLVRVLSRCEAVPGPWGGPRRAPPSLGGAPTAFPHPWDAPVAVALARRS